MLHQARNYKEPKKQNCEQKHLACGVCNARTVFSHNKCLGVYFVVEKRFKTEESNAKKFSTLCYRTFIRLKLPEFQRIGAFLVTIGIRIDELERMRCKRGWSRLLCRAAWTTVHDDLHDVADQDTIGGERKVLFPLEILESIIL